MIRHIVFFKVKEECKDSIPTLVEQFRAMKGKIESLIYLEVGIDFLHSPRSFDVSLAATFATKEDLDAYQVNPIHVAAKTAMASICETIYSVDYEL